LARWPRETDDRCVILLTDSGRITPSALLGGFCLLLLADHTYPIHPSVGDSKSSGVPLPSGPVNSAESYPRTCDSGVPPDPWPGALPAGTMVPGCVAGLTGDRCSPPSFQPFPLHRISSLLDTWVTNLHPVSTPCVRLRFQRPLCRRKHRSPSLHSQTHRGPIHQLLDTRQALRLRGSIPLSHRCRGMRSMFRPETNTMNRRAGRHPSRQPTLPRMCFRARRHNLHQFRE
jgi:hypothetical protein